MSADRLLTRLATVWNSICSSSSLLMQLEDEDEVREDDTEAGVFFDFLTKDEDADDDVDDKEDSIEDDDSISESSLLFEGKLNGMESIRVALVWNSAPVFDAELNFDLANGRVK